jgi:uncharacterized protein YidB (DUF937 family)
MPGLDDLIGSLKTAQGGQGGHAGGGLEDILGGILGGGGGSGSGGGALADVLGGVLGGGGSGGGALGSVLGGGAGSGGLGSVLGGVLGGGGGQTSSRVGAGGMGSMMTVIGPLLATLLANGGLKKILSGMKANGLTAQADSWVGTGENHAIGADQVRQALGDDQINQVAQHLGVDSDQASRVLARVIPGLVNTVTPDGEEPSDSDLDKLVETLKGFAR